MWAGKMARVCSVMRCSMSSGLIWKVFKSVSANTGNEYVDIIAAMVAMYV